MTEPQKAWLIEPPEKFTKPWAEVAKEPEKELVERGWKTTECLLVPRNLVDDNVLQAIEKAKESR